MSAEGEGVGLVNSDLSLPGEVATDTQSPQGGTPFQTSYRKSEDARPLASPPEWLTGSLHAGKCPSPLVLHVQPLGKDCPCICTCLSSCYLEKS